MQSVNNNNNNNNSNNSIDRYGKAQQLLLTSLLLHVRNDSSITTFLLIKFHTDPQNDKEQCNFVIKTLNLVINYFSFFGNIKMITGEQQN